MYQLSTAEPNMQTYIMYIIVYYYIYFKVEMGLPIINILIITGVFKINLEMNFH